MSDAATTVRSLLDAAGITPSEDEYVELVATYPALRVQADSLYAAEFGDDPALIFRAAEITGPLS